MHHWHAEGGADSVLLEDTGASVQIWDLATGRSQPVKRLQASIGDRLFSPDGKRLAMAGMDKVVRIVNAETEGEVAALTCPDQVAVIAFSPDGQSLAAGCEDGSLRIWNVPTAR